MKKKAKLKNNSKTKKNKVKLFFLVFIFIIFTTLTFNYLLSKNINISNELLIGYLLKNSNYSYNKEYDIKELKKNFSVIDLINFNYYSLKKYNLSKKTDNNTNSPKEEVIKEEKDPLIYIYNTHQTEEYLVEDMFYSIKPTVSINNYIMKDIFEQNGLKTIVEERNIKEVLNLNNWNYVNSYKASRIFLEDIKKNYNTLEYYIDVHRDSLSHDKTSITIADKKYAKVLFIIGLENPNYQANLAFTEKINNKINEQYNGLSKGIYKKAGAGVNGVYNQDFSSHTILIEIGGPENNIEEVMNTTIAISNIISEVISQNEV